MLDKIKNMYQNDPVKTIAIGVGAVILAPTVASLLKPVAKATIKTGVILYGKTRETIAETSEQLGDLVAEAQAEVMAEAEKKQDAITISTNPSDSEMVTNN